MFAAVAGKPYSAWLDTVTPADADHRYSLLAAEPSCVFRAKGRTIRISTAAGTDQFPGDPFAVLEELLQQRRGVVVGDPPFPVGAAIGYFGYDLKNWIEDLPATVADDLGLPDCWFGFYDNLVIFDHGAHHVWQISTAAAHPHPHPLPLPPNAGWFRSEPSWLQSEPAGAGREKRAGAMCLTEDPRGGGLRSNFTRAAYCAAVRRAQDYIAAGDIYQVNLSQRFQCDIAAPARDLYGALRRANPAPYGAWLDLGEAQVLSSSPECFLRIHDRDVLTRPIKGTRPRGATPEADCLRAAELRASPKDNAELLMITDLERNDLGKVCEFGSVHVPDLVRVESYATVHHLVATVAGRLRPDVSHVQCVRACFPGGSITGAPKIRAMEIIDELEPHARGVYTGAIGFFGYNGISEFNIAIRTAVYVEQPSRLSVVGARTSGTHVPPSYGRLTFHVGGGIIADSEPDAEYEETLAKAGGILNAIEQLRLRQR